MCFFPVDLNKIVAPLSLKGNTVIYSFIFIAMRIDILLTRVESAIGCYVNWLSKCHVLYSAAKIEKCQSVLLSTKLFS
jgi:hypothetical protein